MHILSSLNIMQRRSLLQRTQQLPDKQRRVGGYVGFFCTKNVFPSTLKVEPRSYLPICLSASLIVYSISSKSLVATRVI